MIAEEMELETPEFLFHLTIPSLLDSAQLQFSVLLKIMPGDSQKLGPFA